MKYRLLTTEELHSLEKEFIEFLALNGITGEMWKEIKETRQSDAEEMVSLFSDVIIESNMRKVRFLIHKSPNKLYTFQCLNNEIYMAALHGDIDFTNTAIIEEALKTKQVALTTSNKKYSQEREQEIFKMIQEGCEISDGKLYKQLMLLSLS